MPRKQAMATIDPEPGLDPWLAEYFARYGIDDEMEPCPLSCPYFEDCLSLQDCALEEENGSAANTDPGGNRGGGEGDR